MKVKLLSFSHRLRWTTRTTMSEPGQKLKDAVRKGDIGVVIEMCVDSRTRELALNWTDEVSKRHPKNERN